MKVILAGGGTGGHLFPGILIANRLKERGDQVKFLVSGRAVEDSFFQSHPYERVALSLEPKGGGAPGKVGLALRLPAAVLQASREIRKFKPDLVLGIGGYVSLPVGIAARAHNVPVDLLEVNAMPGKATRALKPISRRVYCGFEETQHRIGRKGKITGAPIRNDLGKVSKLEARAHFGFDPSAKLLLVMGGSQGAAGVNRAVIGALPYLESAGVQVLHLAGERDFETVNKAYEGRNLRAKVLPFLKEMPMAYAAADLAVSRGGAASVAELAASELPAIIVPYPGHRDRHQWWNGRQLGDGAAILEEKDLVGDRFEQTLRQLLETPERLEMMKKILLSRRKPRAVDFIIESIQELHVQKKN